MTTAVPEISPARRTYPRRFSSWLLLIALLWMAAAAGFSGYMGKWAMHDSKSFAVSAVLDGSAPRPWVYRQLLPLAATAVEQVTPPRLREYLVENLCPAKIFARASGARDPDYGFRYLVVTYLSFLSLFGGLLALWAILAELGLPRLACVLAPMALGVAWPYWLTVGGYYYDNAELMFFALAFLCALHGKRGMLLLLVVPATLNKEAFLFFLPTLYPLLARHGDRRASVAIIGACMLLAGAVKMIVKSYYQ